MAMQELDARPSATTLDLEDLVKSAWKGEIRVPRFQRKFRWANSDVLRLFDSISRGYPIGSLLLWIRPASSGLVHLGPLSVAAGKMERASWVVDGQQRITSLAAALHPKGSEDPRFAITYNLAEGVFQTGTGRSPDASIPLPVVFDLQSLLEWFRDNPQAANYFEKATSIAKTVRQYKVPAYEVTGGGEDVLRDIFDRMNNYGKRLTGAEVFSALYASDSEASEETLSLEAIAERLHDDLQWGIIDPDTVLRAVLARRGPDVTREIRNEFDDAARRGAVEFPSEDPRQAYRAAGDALRAAIEFLRDDCEVPHFAFLPYRYLLVVLARVFAHFPQLQERNRILLRRWYWRAALAGPEFFKGSATGAMRTLTTRIDPGDETGSVRSLLEAVDQKWKMPSVEKFRTNEAATKILMTSWWSRGPRSPQDGRKFTLDQVSDFIGDQTTAADSAVTLVPRSALKIERQRSAGNRVLVFDLDRDGAEVANLFQQQALDIDDSLWSAVLESHQLDGAIGFLQNGSYDSFVEYRRRKIEASLEQFLASRCESTLEDTPPMRDLVLSDDEDA